MAGETPHRNTDTQTQTAGIDLPLLAAVAAIPAVFVLAYLPSHLQMPAIAAVAICVAALSVMLGFALRSDRHAANPTIWDFAGACLLIGIGAGVFSDPHQVSQLFGVAIATP